MDQQRPKVGGAIKGLSKWAALANWHIPKVQCFSRTSDFLHFSAVSASGSRLLSSNLGVVRKQPLGQALARSMSVGCEPLFSLQRELLLWCAVRI